MTTADLAEHLTELLMLTHPPVAVSFHKGTPSTDPDPVEIQPAGCCYWEAAEKGRLATQPSDHANCSVGSYTHGLIHFEAVAAGDDAAALLNSASVGEPDLANAPHLPFRPVSNRSSCLRRRDGCQPWLRCEPREPTFPPASLPARSTGAR
jgi:Uncharacterised ArCR, COG2043